LLLVQGSSLLWWGRELVVVGGDREWTPDFAIIVAESVVRETP